MMKALSVIALSMALVLGGGARPAKANDMENLIGALVALGIVAIAVDEIQDNKKKKKKKAVKYKPVQVKKPRPHHNAKLLPSHCLRVFDGQRRVFGNRCLQNNFRHYARLPGYCRTRVWSNGRQRVGFDARCLRNAGYRMHRV